MHEYNLIYSNLNTYLTFLTIENHVWNIKTSSNVQKFNFLIYGDLGW